MKIAILAGGTGPIALLHGIYHTLEKHLDGVETKLIVNAYDNGLSTGVVRQVMHGQILGPSDVRKNHATRLRLLDPQSPWLSFLDYRFSTSPREARGHCENQATLLAKSLEMKGKDTANCHVVFDAIQEFFSRETTSIVAYDDFSIANIIYAGLAAKSNYSLRSAATLMAAAIGIPDNVLLNDDRSLFLGAITRSGRRISDEGAIVCWANETDPIIDTYFVDAFGKESEPTLCLEAWQTILDADLVLLSSGTQWSSLIPTYASRGFKAAIRDSKAKVVMIMNRVPDKDALGQTASDLINALVPRYFDPGRLNILVDTNSHPDLRDVKPPCLGGISSLTTTELSGPTDPPDKHNPTKLANAIGRVIFNDYLDSDAFVFDYDDTLVGRNGEYPLSSRFNIEGIHRLHGLANVAICTGNTIRALHFGEPPPNSAAESNAKPLLVFADGGINEYAYDARNPSRSCAGGTMTAIKCLAPEVLLNARQGADVGRIIDSLQRAGIPDSKIENRGGAVIAIRPIDPDRRYALVRLALSIVEGCGLEVREAGRTTVEIRCPTISKVPALKHLWATRPHVFKVTYIGDECDTGNDQDIAALANEHAGLRCLHVNGPAITAFFISTLIAALKDHDKH